MKQFIRIFMFLFISTQIICQQKAAAVEIFIGTANVNPVNEEIEFYFDSQGTTWEGTYGPPKEYWITNDEDILYLNYITSDNNNSLGDWKGWDFILSNDYPTYGQFGCGVYKFSTDASDSYFYLDYRDTRYGAYSNCSGHDADIWIKYDYSNHSFLYTSSANMPYWVPITNGRILKIWEIKNQGYPNTFDFPNYWQNCLVVVNDGNDHPHLVWGTYPGGNQVTHYNIYKKVENGNFNYLDSTTELEYTDLSETILTGPYQQNEVTIYYYVKALDPVEGLSEPSNTVNVPRIEGEPEYKLNPDTEIKKIDLKYSLQQNYPNPFNPSTLIKFTLPQNEFVKIEVFNQMGEEVALLVNGQMSSGTYSIDFDGSELASGIYFYQISAGKFNEVKKMMLLK